MRPIRARRLVTTVIAALAFAAAQAEPVADALDRPALAIRHVENVVLLGAARAGARIVAVGERGCVALSDDGGRSWKQARAPVSSTLTSVRFVDANGGWAVGHSGVVLRTRDAGATWERQLDGRTAAGLLLAAATRSAEQASEGSASRAANERALREAARFVQEGADKPFLDVAFVDRNHGFIVGAYGMAFRTQDGGQTWRPLTLDNPKALHLYAVRAQGATVLVAGEQGLLLRSDDGGESFISLVSPYAGSWFTAEILPGGEFLVAGLRGNAFRSVDRGVRWSRTAAAAPVSFVASALQGNRVLLVNQAGVLFASADGGQTFASQTASALPSPSALLPLGDGRVLSFGLRGAMPVDIAPAAIPTTIAEAPK
ncbi:MAG: YCF48-related protein [Caldimonas sp.]